jgi:hypothetical protein
MNYSNILNPAHCVIKKRTYDFLIIQYKNIANEMFQQFMKKSDVNLNYPDFKILI